MRLNRAGADTPPGTPPRPPRPHYTPPASLAALTLANAGPSAPAQNVAQNVAQSDMPNAMANPRSRSRSPLPDARRAVPVALRNPDERDRRGMSRLHHAILYNNRSEIRHLLQQGANPNLCMPDQMSPLMLAVRYRHGDVVQELLKASGLDHDHRDRRGATALHHAAQAGSMRIITMLLAAGADCHALRNDGFTALHVAVFEACPEAVHLLMDAMSGQWNHLAHNGHSPLHLAAVLGHADVVATMASRPGIDINQVTSSGLTALQLAAFEDQVPVIKVILGAEGVDVNAHTPETGTALQIAAGHGHADAVAALVGAPGIDPNFMLDGANAALHLAVKQNHQAMLETLLGAPGIDVNVFDRAGRSALSLCSATAGSAAKDDVALALLGHPDIDPNGAILLLSSSPRVLQHFRQKAGVPDSLSNRKFQLQELERWGLFVPRIGRPNRYASSMTNFQLGMLLHTTRSNRALPPDSARRDLCPKDGAFYLTLALDQALQFHGGYCNLARHYARWLLRVARQEPDHNPSQPNHDHHQFLIGGIAYPRSEIEDMAGMRGNYAMHGELDNIARQGWEANVHQPGFLLRGRDILARLQQRDHAGLSLEKVVATVRLCIDAVPSDAMASQRLRAALASVEPLQARAGRTLSDRAKAAMANWISEQPQTEHAALHMAWRVQLMRFGLQQTLSQRGDVNEGGLTTTAPETLRLLQSYIHWQSGQPGRQAIAQQLQQAMLDRLHDIGSEPRVCNTGCVQRLLDAPAGIDDTLMAREPHDRAIFDEILRIGSVVNQAFDDQVDEGDQGIVHECDQKNYDEISSAVRKDILRATAIDDLVRRRGWDRPKVDAQLDTILDAL